MVQHEKYVRHNIKKRKKLKNAFQYFMASFCGLVVAGAKIKGLPICLGAAFVGAAGAGVFGAMSLLGVLLGYIFFWGFPLSGGYIASAFFVYTIAFVCQYTIFSERAEFMPSVVTFVTGITLMYGNISLNRGGDSLLYRVIFELILSYSATCVFRSLVFGDKYTQDERLFSVVVFISCMTNAFAECYIMERFAVGGIVANICLFIISYVLPSSRFYVLAAVLGIAFDLSVGRFFYLFLNSLYSICLSGLKIRNKFINILVLCFALIFTSMYSNEEQIQSVLFEVLISSVVFLIIPKRFFDLLALCVTSQREDEQICEQMNHRLLEEMFDDLQCCLQEPLNTCQEKDLESTCFTVFDEVCSLCNRKDICRSNHGEKIYDMICEMVIVIEERGMLDQKDIPVWFVEYCDKHNEIAEEIIHRLKDHYKDMVSSKEKNDQYILLCDLFRMLTSSTLRAIEKLPKHTRIYSRTESVLQDYLREHGYSSEVHVKECINGRKYLELTGRDAERVVNDNRCLENMVKMMDRKLRVLQDSKNSDCILLVEAEPYSISVGVASKKKKGERVCGDQCSYFKTTDGVFYAILSDGLGTGEYAAIQSRKMIERLERFIICGISPEEALKMVYTIFELKNVDSLSCATVDLFSVNLYSGEAQLFKIGSPSSYCVSDRDVHIYKANKLPAGLMMNYMNEIESQNIQLRAEDIFVLMTDGVFVFEPLDFVNMVCEEIGMKNLARRILVDSQKVACLDDDMTVITVKMDVRR